MGVKKSALYFTLIISYFFEIFEKSADFATKFGWGISATKGSPLWKKNEIDQKRYPNISVFFGFHFVFSGFSGTRGNFPLRKKKNEMDRITPNWTEQLGYLPYGFLDFGLTVLCFCLGPVEVFITGSHTPYR